LDPPFFNGFHHPPRLSGVLPVISENLVYVIYTSGSTGKPKGVQVNHFNVTRLFAATDPWYRFNKHDVWVLFHSFAFDFSVWEMWGALLYGGRLIAVPYWVTRSPTAFYDLLAREGVTVLNQTPSSFHQLIQVEEGLDAVKPLALRLVIFGGEALELQSLKPWLERHGDKSPQLVNMYGITETTVHVTYHPITMADLNSTASVIGCPIPDLQVYILDQHLQPVPIGVPGELHIAGAGLAWGYLNRSELTRERFIPNPFSDKPGAGLYKTGDLARYLPSGDIEYLGRIDHQVKIRGFRIELGEIEAILSQHQQVRDVVVIAREDQAGNKRLVAYIVPALGQVVTVKELLQYLRTRLPDYMVPQHFVELQALPVTPNGKIDRRALPAPEYDSAVSGQDYIAPRTPTEIALANIWTTVLGRKCIGAQDSFFDIGGHSLLAIQVVSRVRNALQVELPVWVLFEAPILGALAERIEALRYGYMQKAAMGVSNVASEDREQIEL
jgi:amino acid adenylation domain-containing protein